MVFELFLFYWHLNVLVNENVIGEVKIWTLKSN